MSSELSPVRRTGIRVLARARRATRLAGWLPVFTWVALAACQSEGTENAESSQAPANPHEGVPGAPANIDTEAMQRQMALMTQLQAIDQVLAPVREQAMRDPEMQAKEQEIMGQLEVAMESITPGIGGMRVRFDSLRTEYGAAQQAGDQEHVQSLGGELQMLQASIQETQSQALQQEDVALAIDGMREALFARMRAIDPGADSLLTQAEEVMQELEAMAESAKDGS